MFLNTEHGNQKQNSNKIITVTFLLLILKQSLSMPKPQDFIACRVCATMMYRKNYPRHLKRLHKEEIGSDLRPKRQRSLNEFINTPSRPAPAVSNASESDVNLENV